MLNFNLNMRYTNKTENTEIVVGVNFEFSEQQDDQSPKRMLGLILDYISLAVMLFEIVPILLDTVSSVF
jgi:hypothetical protein